MDFSKLIFRASALGSIMSDPGGKTNLEKFEAATAALLHEQTQYDILKKKDGPKAAQRLAAIGKWQAQIAELDAIKYDEVLSTGARTYLKRTYAKLKYNKRSASEFFDIKYAMKGLKSEMDSVAILRKLDGIDYVKNKKTIENDYISGIPDLFTGKTLQKAEYVIELKTSWDIDTFYQNMDSDVKTRYWWQLQAYMWLTEASAGELSYCLVTTPPHLIKDEQERLFRKMGVRSRKDARYLKAAAGLAQSLNFDDIPINERRIKYEVPRDDNAISRISKKIDVCRKYLQEIEEMHNNFSQKHVL